MNNQIQIHATNVEGLGAKNVVKSLITSIDKEYSNKVNYVYSNSNDFNVSNLNIKNYNRVLPKSLSRLFEIIFSRLLFKNRKTLVLGDIPLTGIKNQTLFVHQANLISPKVNKFSSKEIKFRISRFLFKINLKYVDRIIVQSDFMKKELGSSYKALPKKIDVIPLPNTFKLEINKSKKSLKKLVLFYPALNYKHKNHDFLFEIAKSKISKDFEIYVTLEEKEFEKYESLMFVKNLGVISHHEVLEFYKKTDILLNLSNLESFCLPLVEAIYLNIPVLTIERTYTKWMCEDFGYYFTDKESFFSSLNEIKEAIKNQNLKPIAKAKKKFKHNWEKVAGMFLE